MPWDLLASAYEEEVLPSFRFFVEVDVHPVSTRVSFPSSGALWASMERSMPPLVLTRHQLGEQLWTLGRTLGPGPVTLDLHAWLGVGTAAEC
jgi:hypothetical protein